MDTYGSPKPPTAAEDMADLAKISYEYTPSPKVQEALKHALAKVQSLVSSATEEKSTVELNSSDKSKDTTAPAAVDFKFQRKPVVAIVGRPNVGKSTLFNRLIRQSKSLITDIAGTTRCHPFLASIRQSVLITHCRDRKYGVCEWRNFPMLLIDTGGMFGEGADLYENIHEQAGLAVAEADFILCLMGTLLLGVKLMPGDY